jgi:hypothetical protein
MNQTIESALSQSIPLFDQIVKGNVSIKKLSKYRYRITFSKIGKFLIYQVWDKDDVNKMNAKRQVGYVSAKEWVKRFKRFNTILKQIGKPLFTPTTIMETEDDCNYAFVIHTVSLNSCDKVVFTVSTEEISPQNNSSKKLVRLPLGKCNHVRFDIDNSTFPFDYDYFFSCINNQLTEEISKNPKFSITRDKTFSDSDKFYERYTVNGNIPLETLKTNLSYSEIETRNYNYSDNSYLVYDVYGNGLKYGNTTIILSKGVEGVENDSYGFFRVDKEGIVLDFLIIKSTFDKENTIPIFDSISFINKFSVLGSDCKNYINK